MAETRDGRTSAVHTITGSSCFTERGFDVVPIPRNLRKAKKAVEEGVNNWDNLKIEGNIDAVITTTKAQVCGWAPYNMRQLTT